MIRKQFPLEKDGEWLTINTGVVDRDRDRVLPSGVVLENYLKNPVVMWGHNYRDPWALIGRAAEVEVTEERIRSRPEFRQPANETDPMHIILALWNAGLVQAASIGFNPLARAENEFGGFDFTKWELLEWSLVPVPANQEALRLAVKGMDEGDSATEPPGDVAWIRRLVVESDKGQQTLFAGFYGYEINVPEDAEKLGFDENGELVLIPEPNAGKTLKCESVTFIPPIAYTDEKWGDDAVYACSAPEQPDEELVEPWEDEYQVIEISPVLLSLPRQKSGERRAIAAMNVCRLTKGGVDRVRELVRRAGVMKQNNDAGQTGTNDGMGLTPEEADALSDVLETFCTELEQVVGGHDAE